MASRTDCLRAFKKQWTEVKKGIVDKFDGDANPEVWEGSELRDLVMKKLNRYEKEISDYMSSADEMFDSSVFNRMVNSVEDKIAAISPDLAKEENTVMWFKGMINKAEDVADLEGAIFEMAQAAKQTLDAKVMSFMREIPEIIDRLGEGGTSSNKSSVKKAQNLLGHFFKSYNPKYMLRHIADVVGPNQKPGHVLLNMAVDGHYEGDEVMNLMAKFFKGLDGRFNAAMLEIDPTYKHKSGDLIDISLNRETLNTITRGGEEQSDILAHALEFHTGAKASTMFPDAKTQSK